MDVCFLCIAYPFTWGEKHHFVFRMFQVWADCCCRDSYNRVARLFVFVRNELAMLRCEL